MLAPLIENQPGEFRDVLEKLRREGFVRARIDGQMVELDRTEPIRLKKGERHTIEAVVDRLVVRDGIRVRLTDSIETALKWGGNRIVVLCQTPKTPNAQRPTSNAESEAWAECRYPRITGMSNTLCLCHSTIVLLRISSSAATFSRLTLRMTACRASQLSRRRLGTRHPFSL